MLKSSMSQSDAPPETSKGPDSGVVIMAMLTAFSGLLIGLLVGGHPGASVTTLVAAVLASGIGWWARGLV